MLIRHLVTAILATISLLYSYQVSKTLAHYIFDEVFDTATNFDKCNFDYSNFEGNFDPFEEPLDAFESARSFEPVDTSNADINNGESASTFSDFCFSSSTFSDYPADSPTSDSPSPPPASVTTDLAPTKSAPSVTGHSDSIYGIGCILIILITCSCWFERRPPPLPPPLPDPPPARPRSLSPPLPPSPLPPSPPPQRPPSPPPPQVSPPTLPSAASAPASAVKDRLALVAAPARQVAGARRKSRRAKKRS